jgi:hypothetical protein
MLDVLEVGEGVDAFASLTHPEHGGSASRRSNGQGACVRSVCRLVIPGLMASFDRTISSVRGDTPRALDQNPLPGALSGKSNLTWPGPREV